MRVLVTGHCGFIGRRVVRRLVRDGHQVVGLDLADGDDVTDAALVAERIAGCAGVIHLAAKVGLERSMDDADAYVRSNDLGTAMVLRGCAAAGVDRFVLASSMVVYGEGRFTCVTHGTVRPGPRRPADLDSGQFEPPCPRCGRPLEPGLVGEDAALDPRSVYAATKVHAEQLAAIWADHTAGTAIALRYHNVYGPGMPRDTPYAGVTALFRAALARGQAPRVFEDGRQRRNFVHVDDIAAATVAGVDAPVDRGLTAVNVGSDTVTTVGEMAAALARHLGGPEPVITGEYRPGDVRHITADCSAATRLLGWRPQVDLADGVATIEED